MKKRSGFTLIELLVVIAIIAILAAILFPVFAAARERARTASCLSNVSQITRAVIQYSNDYNGFWPFCVDFEDKNNRGSEAVVQNAPYLWEVLASYTKSGEIWKCPSDKGMTWQKAGPLSAKTGNVVKKCCDMWKINPSDADLTRLRASYATNYINSFYPSGVPKPCKMDQAKDLTKAMVVFDVWQTSSNGPDPTKWNSQWHNRKYPDSSWNIGFFDGHAKNMTFKDIRFPPGRPDENTWLFSAYWARPEGAVGW